MTKNKPAILHLHLKKWWFDKIKNGEKLEEYRLIKPHYIECFTKEIKVNECVSNNTDANITYEFKTYDKVIFYLAYPSAKEKDCMVAFKDPKIRIDFGKEEWGAPRYKVFVVSWGEQTDV